MEKDSIFSRARLSSNQQSTRDNRLSSPYIKQSQRILFRPEVRKKKTSDFEIFEAEVSKWKEMRELEADQMRFDARKKREYDMTHTDEKDQKVRRIKKKKAAPTTSVENVVEVDLINKVELPVMVSPIKTQSIEQSGGEVTLFLQSH